MTQQQSNQPAVATTATQTPATIFKNTLASTGVAKMFEQALGKSANQFMSGLLDLYSNDTTLQQCDSGEVIKQALKGATLGLPLVKSLGFAYLVPFFNRNTQRQEPTFIIGYKGWIQLALRSGAYKVINADVIYEGELQQADKLSGSISLDGQKTSEKVIGYFAHIVLNNGFTKTLLYTTEEMVNYAKTYSKPLAKASIESIQAAADQPYRGGNNSGKVGWMGDFHAMAIKTVLRQLIGKYGIVSIDMASAFDADTDDTPEQIANSDTTTTAQAHPIAFEEVEDTTTQPAAPEYKPSF